MDKIIIFSQTWHLKDPQIREDGSLRLFEEKIIEEKQVVLWVNSGESGCHHIPHVHASFSDKEYSISIDGQNRLLAPDKEDKYYRFIVKNYFNEDNLQLFRSYWNNKTDAKIKFQKNNNGEYLNIYKMEKIL